MLKQRFPWLNTKGLGGGCLGLESEGWFDTWNMLQSLILRNKYLGRSSHHSITHVYHNHFNAISFPDRYCIFGQMIFTHCIVYITVLFVTLSHGFCSCGCVCVVAPGEDEPSQYQAKNIADYDAFTGSE